MDYLLIVLGLVIIVSLPIMIAFIVKAAYSEGYSAGICDGSELKEE